MLNRKLLEKQREQNCFGSYEVHIGHFFYSVNATVSFEIVEPCLYSDFKFFTGLTDRQTERQNRLLNPFAHAHVK